MKASNGRELVKVGDNIKRLNASNKLSNRVWTILSIDSKHLSLASDNKRLLIEKRLLNRWVKVE